MKFNLAAQTLSKSVATAIDFCRDDLGLPEFENSKPTTEFILLFDALFDVFNSRNSFGKQFKAPLREENRNQWLPLLAEAADYIMNLRRKDGSLLIESRLKTGFVGFLNGIFAMQEMFEELVTKGPLTEIMTYKFSQDHLELYFAAVRSKLGANNNPSCKQFSEIHKRLLVHNQIRGFNSNVDSIDSTELLTISARKIKSDDADMLSSSQSDHGQDHPTDVDGSMGCLSSRNRSSLTFLDMLFGWSGKKFTVKNVCLLFMTQKFHRERLINFFTERTGVAWSSLLRTS